MKVSQVIRLIKGPSAPGPLVKECLDGHGLSVADAAQSLGLTCQQVDDLIADRMGITPELAARLEKTVGNTADTWLRIQRQYDEAQEEAARHG